MGNLWHNIIAGIIAGTIAGIVAGLVLAGFSEHNDRIDKREKRRDQVKYLSDLIAAFRTQIFDTKEDVFFPPTNQTLSRDNIRKARFDELRRELESALAERSSRLTYDEIRQVKNVFIGLHKLHPKLVPTAKWYIDTFRKAESINWLKLPPTTLTPESK